VVRIMVFYHGECGLRDPRILSLQAILGVGATGSPEKDAGCFLIPRDSFGRWKESGRTEELLHLGPTRNSSLIKHRTLPTARQQNTACRQHFHRHVI
jgi:hypothetical protein